jgi:uncharacterized protein YlxW (UPF0749 family)
MPLEFTFNIRLDASPAVLAWMSRNLLTKNDLAVVLQREEQFIVSQLSDAIAAANSKADAAISRVQADVTNLKNQIATLQATVDSGGATPEDMNNLAALQAKLDALDPTQPATLPPDQGGTPTT